MTITDAFHHLASIEPFYGFDESTVKSFQDELTLIKLAKNDVLFKQGELGDCMYVLLEGLLGVELQEVEGDVIKIDELHPVICVGEMALLTGQPRAATVRALSDSELIAFSSVGFERLKNEFPHHVCEFTKSISLRMQRTKLAGILSQIFGELDPAALHDIQAELAWRQVSSGEVLFRQGDAGDSMVILVSGRLQMTAVSQMGETIVLGEIEPGESVGEFAVLTNEPRSATIRAIRDSNVIEFTKPVFDRLLEKYPRAMMQITRMLIERQKRVVRLAKRTGMRAVSVALVSTDPETPLVDFAEELLKHLSEMGSILYLDRPRFDQAYGMEGAAQTPLDDPTHPILDGWMSDRELEHQLILLVADPTWSAWSQRCVRHADRVLLLNLAHSNPELKPMETAIRSMCDSTCIELVLLHPAHSTFPSKSGAWLSRRKATIHHHIRIGDKTHYQRLARHLTGTSIGLVLSGGAARGFAHLGVMRAMEELGIHADRVGGTSMGALLGAGVGMGLSFEEMYEKCQIYANPKTLFDYTLPLSSLMASKKLTNTTKNLYEDLQIEDLWNPFFCVSVNLTRAEPVVHQNGQLWKCVRTSIAIPGVFTPIQHNGDVHVDGGLMNNYPVDVMRGFRGQGPIIGVNVSRQGELTKTYECGTSINGFRVLLSRINPFIPRAKVPSLLGTLMRSMEVGAVYQMKSSGATEDVLIQPVVDRFASLDFAAYEPIVDVGYQCALPVLQNWLDQSAEAHVQQAFHIAEQI